MILLDVKRTRFYTVEESELVLLLKHFVGKYPSLGYYQGLNFYGLFLLEFTGSFERSLQLFSHLSESMLHKFFRNSFQNLKCLFFIFDQLVEVYVPRLSRKFKSQSISSR